MVHHRRGLRRLLNDDELLAAIESDWQSARGLSEQRSAMLTFSVKLTLRPGEMTAEDTTALRQVGFSDRDILDIVEVVAYYAYANRIADGLGIELEPWIP